ncbi:MAG: tRNA (adenosine(37)-N6)-threonylcarbamoyltransferase complex ATPase subunit type 1 TsaE [Chitinophagaceae bacterium]|nr:tRNA (adenosine(37)-N6)-threonylcarbamoyltransferase complex ATPase subunit type 1 TsaE [Chitinophagaceae bacterium]MBK8951302.1 tRNA (adenosine(37)-N6)-threonylcarbamoyltransferase complex ATPase subunit type 1 TsaE [Chitinophagaceae bacterium]
MEWTYTLDEIKSAAAAFWKTQAGKKVFAFYGQMGAGKTTFVIALCEAKGVSSTVSSPTFSIINDYDCGLETIYHMDLYRLKDETEAQRAGVEDALYSGNFCLVEWPEKAPGIFPEDTVYVSIDVVDEKTRRLKINGI